MAIPHRDLAPILARGAAIEAVVRRTTRHQLQQEALAYAFEWLGCKGIDEHGVEIRMETHAGREDVWVTVTIDDADFLRVLAGDEVKAEPDRGGLRLTWEHRMVQADGMVLEVACRTVELLSDAQGQHTIRLADGPDVEDVIVSKHGGTVWRRAA